MEKMKTTQNKVSSPFQLGIKSSTRCRGGLGIRRVPPCPYPSPLPDFVTFTWAGAAPSWARPLENNRSRKKHTNSEKAFCISIFVLELRN